jgi:hypothetical protein
MVQRAKVKGGVAWIDDSLGVASSYHVQPQSTAGRIPFEQLLCCALEFEPSHYRFERLFLKQIGLGHNLML